MLRTTEFTETCYRVHDGVAWITLNRPHTRNALTPRLYQEIKWSIRTANLDDGVDILVITGAGVAFSSGGDLKDALRRMEQGGALAMHDFFDSVPFWEIRDSPKVVIAAINGDCFAGGLITALWCDLALAAESARFAFTEAKVGLVDAISPALLFGRTPSPKFKRMVFTGRPIDAFEAERIGLVGEVVPDAELVDRVHQLIGEIRGTSAPARALYKRYANALIPRPLNDGGRELVGSEAAIEGLSAFGAKRSAQFRTAPQG